MAEPAPVFRRESRTVQRFLGLPGADKVRLWPMVAAILDRERADHQEIGDQVVLGALNSVLTAGIMAGRYRDVYNALGKLLGLTIPTGNPESEPAPRFPGGKSLPSGEGRKPPVKVATR